MRTKTRPKVEKKWYSPEEAHEAYGPSAYTIRELIREGVIAAKMVGRFYRIHESEMDQYMASLPDA